MELHHIQQQASGGDNSVDNCIPLCLDCHAEVGHYNSKHPKGRKFTEAELKEHRNSWYKKVASSGGTSSNPDTLNLDRAMLKRFVKVLPQNGSIAFVRENSFAGFSFEINQIDDFHNYERVALQDPTFEFIDIDLEGIRAELSISIRTFLSLIAINTFPTHMTGRNTVPPDWEETDTERFNDVVEKIHNSTTLICDKYDFLIKTGRRKLGIDP